MMNRNTAQQHTVRSTGRSTGRGAALIGVVALALLLGDISPATARVTEAGKTTLLQGQRIEPATVVEVLPGQIAVNFDHLQPRYLQRKEDLSLSIGDRIDVVINAQNAVIDYYPAMAQRPQYQIVEGRLAASLEIGHEHAVVETKKGGTRAFAIKPAVRSKIASIPVGVQALFLVHNNTIVDSDFASEHAVERAEAQPHAKSPIKGAHRQVPGTLVEPAAKGHVTIMTRTGNDERSYEVRSHVMTKLASLTRGQDVILLVDRENKVIDVAIPPETAG